MLESRITALDATAVPTAVEPISRALSSPTTAVIPSSAFNSAAVDVTAVEFRTNLPSPTIILSPNVAEPASLPSIVKKSVSAPPSVPLKIISLSLAAASRVMLPELVVRRTAASPIERLSAASEETEISTKDKSVPSDAST